MDGFVVHTQHVNSDCSLAPQVLEALQSKVETSHLMEKYLAGDTHQVIVPRVYRNGCSVASLKT